MSQRIVVCCDGTWNSHDDPSPTNVFKLRGLVSPVAPDGTTQAVYYDNGVGTRGGWFRRLVDGATGHGLSENVREAYRALVDNYDPGDALFFFGFSRGAFTVRSLGGLIRNCGILRRDRRHLVDDAYALYRDRGESSAPDSDAAKRFRADNAVEDRTVIECISVWDTVGALGNPMIRHGLVSRRLRFHDVKLSSSVRSAFQALAVDEHRKHFAPSIWEQQEHAAGQVLEQVWFIGAHADVGGGYDSRDLSNIALEWLVRRAASRGLAIDERALEAFVGDGSVRYSSMPHDSQQGFYKLFAPFDRDVCRSDADAARARRKKTPVDPATNEALHWTVVARWKLDLGYRPECLRRYIAKHPRVLEGDPRDNPVLAAVRPN